MANIDNTFANKLTPEQQNKVHLVSRKLGVNPNDLLSVMMLESGIDSSRYNGITGNAVGLIQFHVDPGKDYKTIGGKQYKLEDIAKMDFIEQMDLVQDYYTDIKKSYPNADLSNFNELYTATFYPSAIGKGDDFKIGGKKVAEQNPGFAVDGQVTKGSFLNAAHQRAEQNGIGNVVKQTSQTPLNFSEPDTNTEIQSNMNNRNKSDGFFGKLKNSSGKTITERPYNAIINGEEIEIPLLIPTLSEQERNWLLEGNPVRDNDSPVAQMILEKATQHAQDRISNGLSPFYDENFLPDLNRRASLQGDDTGRNMTSEEKKRRDNAIKSYRKELQEIKDMGYDAIQENIAINILHNKYYKAGDLGIIQKENEKVNKSRDQFFQDNPDWENLSPTKQAAYRSKENWERERENLWNRTYSSISEDGISYYQRGEDSSNILPSINIDEFNQNYIQNEYLAQEPTTTDPSEVIAGESEDVVSEQAQPEEQPQEPEIDPYSYFQNDSVPVERFEYHPEGWERSLLSALPGIGLGVAATITGMNMADSEMPVRDERISEALLNYGAEMKKISQMGLAPEVEGDLKNKLASAYQVGLSNLTRASGGNRNLVLGNQGQLDQARMQGVTDIALMDLDRRDKAMAAYGEVVQYIAEFDRNKAIENNQREYQRYREDRAMGAQLASQGMAKVMDEINNQIENGPGSYNDMFRKYIEYGITGVIPGKKEGYGSQAWVDEQAEIKKQRESEDEKMTSYLDTLSEDERIAFTAMMENNPNLKPSVNNNIKAEEIISRFKEEQGIVEPLEPATAESVLSSEAKSDKQPGVSVTGHVNSENIISQEGESNSSIISLSPEQLADDSFIADENVYKSMGSRDPNYNDPTIRMASDVNSPERNNPFNILNPMSRVERILSEARGEANKSIQNTGETRRIIR